LITSLGDHWRGEEFAHVVTTYHLNPGEVARTWSYSEVFEAYYLLRLRDLRNPKGLV